MKRAQFWTADSGHSQLHMTLSRTEIPLASPSSNNTNTSLLLIKSHFKTVTGLQRNEIICLVWGCGTDCHEESVAAWPLCSNSCLDGKFRSLFCCNVFRLYTCREMQRKRIHKPESVDEISRSICGGGQISAGLSCVFIRPSCVTGQHSVLLNATSSVTCVSGSSFREWCSSADLVWVTFFSHSASFLWLVLLMPEMSIQFSVNSF
ncbi:hypothetical protein MJG53_019419 [Ovis ammon polii x Ovis aries]|uniref:Uncharacterized protein n=1 Tax=Ovis ammon polii x Ovis aries TaxID=2918886 RepID=A0ACB9TZP9_9CETA|nr:hypothetical protein MJG53_019419 [Ovis ammon polii x Ovis aries]